MFTSVKRRLTCGCESAILTLGGYLSANNYYQMYSHSESKSRTESKCEVYNSFYDIFFEKRREELCRREPGCTFRGKGITGTCYPKYKIAKYKGGMADASGVATERESGLSKKERGSRSLSETASFTSPPSQSSPSSSPSSSSSSSVSQSTSLVSPTRTGVVVKGEEEDSQIYIEVLMKQQFASSVADQIVNSHQVLQNKGTVNELGALLGMCLEYPTVQSPIRSLVYFYLHTDVTMANILWQLEWQRNYFFSGDGKEWTETQLRDLFMWWTTTEDCRAVLYPLVLWAIRDRDVAVVPLSRMNADYYNYYQEWFAETMEAVVVDHLKAEREQLKIAASEVVKGMLISNFKTKSDPDDKANVTVPSAATRAGNSTGSIAS